MCQTKLNYFQIMYYNLGPSVDKPSAGFLKMGCAIAAWLVDNMRNETVTAAPLSQNKASFKAYATTFEERRQAIDKERVEREAIKKPTICASTTSARPSTVIASSLAPLVLGRNSTKDLSIKVARTLGKSATRFTPNLAASAQPAKSKDFDIAITDEADDNELCHVAAAEEQEFGSCLLMILLLLPCYIFSHPLITLVAFHTRKN